MLRQIVYVSTAAKLDKGDIAAILSSAHAFNGAHDITGFLLYNGRNFLQLIEGDQASLMNLMGKLSRDTRHSGIVVMENSEIADRSFPDWQMRLLSMADDIPERRDELDLSLAGKMGDETYRTVMNFASLN